MLSFIVALSLSNTPSKVFCSYFQALSSNVDNPQFCTCVRIRVSNRNTTSNSLAKSRLTFWHSPDEGIAGDEDSSHRSTLNERHSRDAVDRREERHRTRWRHKSQFRLFSSSSQSLTCLNASSRSISDANTSPSSIAVISLHSSVKASIKQGRTYWRCKATVYQKCKSSPEWFELGNRPVSSPHQWSEQPSRWFPVHRSRDSPRLIQRWSDETSTDSASAAEDSSLHSLEVPRLFSRAVTTSWKTATWSANAYEPAYNSSLIEP